LKESVGELEAASKALQEAGQSLTREKLLDLVIASPSDARIRAYVSMARTGMDYTFFQILSDKIESAQGDEKVKLEELREKLLDHVNEVDRQLENVSRKRRPLSTSCSSRKTSPKPPGRTWRALRRSQWTW
jgi:hypothetical protein